DAHPDRVVVEEHNQYCVQIAHVGWQWIVELAIDAHNVRQDGLRQALAPRLRGEPIEDQARVLRVDLPRWADGTGEKLARVAAARTQLGDAHAGLDAGEGEQLARVTARVERTVSLRTVGRVDCGM